jgi:hypothetical protein
LILYGVVELLLSFQIRKLKDTAPA